MLHIFDLDAPPTEEAIVITTADLVDLHERIERARRVAAEFRKVGNFAKAEAHERLAEHLEAEIAERTECGRRRRDRIRVWRAP